MNFNSSVEIIEIFRARYGSTNNLEIYLWNIKYKVIKLTREREIYEIMQQIISHNSLVSLFVVIPLVIALNNASNIVADLIA